MKYTFFQVLAASPEAGCAELNEFLANHRVVGIERQFVAEGAQSFWSLCVVTSDGGNAAGERSRRRIIDYRDVLSPDHFARFARLRALRNHLAETQATPAYAIFTNEQLAAIAQLEQPSRQALAAIEGIGEKRLEQYADRFLAELLRNADGQD